MARRSIGWGELLGQEGDFLRGVGPQIVEAIGFVLASGGAAEDFADPADAFVASILEVHGACRWRRRGGEAALGSFMGDTERDGAADHDGAARDRDAARGAERAHRTRMTANRFGPSDANNAQGKTNIWEFEPAASIATQRTMPEGVSRGYSRSPSDRSNSMVWTNIKPVLGAVDN